MLGFWHIAESNFYNFIKIIILSKLASLRGAPNVGFGLIDWVGWRLIVFLIHLIK